MQGDMKHIITEIFDAIPVCDYWFVASPDWYGGTDSTFLWRITVRHAQHFRGTFQYMCPKHNQICICSNSTIFQRH